jgi:hypothetical protein
MSAQFKQASQIKRVRATSTEMEVRAQFLIDYANDHGPVTVRGLYYQAEVAGIPGIDKTENGYNKVQAQVLNLRRQGRLPYGKISDSTRYMRKPHTHDGWEEALQETAKFYRKDLWSTSNEAVEIWIEKSALAGVLYPVTSEYDVALMPTGGFTSETFAYGAVENVCGTGQKLVIYALYDFDRSGRDASASLKEKVDRFGQHFGVEVAFNELGLSLGQIASLGLPTRPHKSKTVADQRWPHSFAAELDAIPPDTLRQMVREAISRHLPMHDLRALQTIEKAERETLLHFIGGDKS